MWYLDNFLTSNHTFSHKNLMKFRFALLNSIMVINIFFTFLGVASSLLGTVEYSIQFTVILTLYLFFSIYLVFALRKNKEAYDWIIVVFIFGMLLLFTSVLFMHLKDEFRLIAFYFLLMTGFVLMGKQKGLILSIIMMLGLFVILHSYDLHFSQNAIRTFFSFFIAFSIFLYLFIDKVEKDALEFQLLNDELKSKVSKEVLQRLEQEKMLLRQCRMANMGEMIDAIAHQWRQPLMNINAVLMNIDILTKEEIEEGILLNKNLTEIASLTSHMSHTIEDFRTLYQVEKQKSTFVLQELIEDVLALMKNNLQNVEVDIHETAPIKIYSYKSELTQVMITLLSNAKEALYARNITPKYIDIKLREENDFILLEIEDNAGGIKNKALNKIFDPYFTTKKQTGGTGLGLYITQIIIEHNIHGEIMVSNTSKGAKFSLKIPKK